MKASRAFSTARTCCNSSLNSHIRKAQSTELFRSRFLESSNSGLTMSVKDLDDLIRTHRARPSLFVNGYEFLGVVLGTASKVAPSGVRTAVEAAVKESVDEVFNESIRELKTAEEALSEGHDAELARMGEIKETIKYHRDCVGSATTESLPLAFPFNFLRSSLSQVLRLSSRV